MSTSALSAQTGFIPVPAIELSAPGIPVSHEHKIIEAKDLEKDSGVVPFVLSTHFLQNQAVQKRDLTLLRLHESLCVDTSHVVGNKTDTQTDTQIKARLIVQSAPHPKRISSTKPHPFEKMPASIASTIASFATVADTAALAQTSSSFAKRSA